MKDLQLAGLWVVYPGKTAYALADGIYVLPLSRVGAEWNYESGSPQRASS
jgi:hypothetical protein